MSVSQRDAPLKEPVTEAKLANMGDQPQTGDTVDVAKRAGINVTALSKKCISKSSNSSQPSSPTDEERAFEHVARCLLQAAGFFDLNVLLEDRGLGGRIETPIEALDWIFSRDVLCLPKGWFSYLSGSDLNKASRFLKALRSSIKLEDVPSSLLSESCIQQLLRENPMYYVNLARSHARRKIFELENTPLLYPYPSKLTWRGSRYLAAAQSYLERLHHSSDTLNNPAASSFWTPCAVDFESSFFVNGSASRKTRLFLEGLHQNWGFYFIAAIDSSTLGSKDISTTLLDFEMETVFRILPLKEDPSYEACLDINTRFAYRQFSGILLTRLVVFKRFLEAASGKPDDLMRHRWLFAQLQPLFLQSSEEHRYDPFDELREMMQEWIVPIEFFDEAIRETLDSIFSLCPRAPGTPFFIVIDEGNDLADGGQFSFPDAFGDDRPILKELLTTWKHHLQTYDVTLIVAGTEIPRKHFQGDEWSNFQWCSDTGDFGVPELQRQYVSKFSPSSMVSSASGEELQLRMWRWFRGRTICDDYEPRDGEVYSHTEEPRIYVRRYLPRKMLDPQYYPSVKAAVHDALIHCLVTLDHRLILGIDRIDAVSRGVGRFIDPNMEQIVIDEPRNIPLFAHVFSQPQALADVFSFSEALPEWANQTANLVDLSTDLGEKEIGELHYTPGTSRRLAYLKDKHRTVFCIHSANSASPALLFSLRLEDKSLVWLFLHVRLDGEAEELVTEVELQDMLKSQQPENLLNDLTNKESSAPKSPAVDQGFPLETPSTAKSESSNPPKESEVSDDIRQLLESLPNRNQSAGACSLLRVVASLGADAKLDRLDLDADCPIAELNTRFVQSITEKFSVKNILEDVVANATYIGDNTGVKRKSVDDGPTLKRQRSASLFNNNVQEVDI
ncbi:hypothetical protein IW262DRAFT_1296691 [Armillaria fumosa]|nr:hypothetical protein IW262DRAFT_1296691 [Armillaria fumosa]